MSPNVPYLNSDNLNSEIIDYIADDLVNGFWPSLTNNVVQYNSGDIHVVPESQMPSPGTSNTWYYDNLGGNFYAVWMNGGVITAAAVSFTEGGGILKEYRNQEEGSSLSDLDDYNVIPSIFNDPGGYVEPTTYDIAGFDYVYSRPAGTIAPDIEPSAQGLSAAPQFSVPGAVKYDYQESPITEFYKKGTGKISLDELTADQKKAYEILVEKSVRAPDKMFF